MPVVEIAEFETPSSRGMYSYSDMLQAVADSLIQPEPTHHPKVAALIKQYQTVFEKPSTLPPRRGKLDHEITLTNDPIIPKSRPLPKFNQFELD
jgi:hypothetical protein